MPARLAIALAVAASVGACTGSIDGDGAGGPDGGGGPGTTPPAPEVDILGPAVLPHVQRFANAVCAAHDACYITTREGHHPAANRALDILASAAYGKLPTDDNALGDAVAAFALAHQAEHGITYIIWRQRYNDGSGWDPMEDRGGTTQNHYDHVHVGFEPAR